MQEGSNPVLEAANVLWPGRLTGELPIRPLAANQQVIGAWLLEVEPRVSTMRSLSLPTLTLQLQKSIPAEEEASLGSLHPTGQRPPLPAVQGHLRSKGEFQTSCCAQAMQLDS